MTVLLGLRAKKSLYISPYIPERELEVHVEIAFRGKRYRVRGFREGYEVQLITPEL